MMTQIRSYREINWSTGLCRTSKYDPDIWFADDDATTQVAANVCQLCPIRDKCLQWALDTGQKYGVWGGLTEDQRKVTGWVKQRVKCPGCKSKNVSQVNTGNETCLGCGLSWKV